MHNRLHHALTSCILIATTFIMLPLSAVVVDEDLEIEGHYLDVTVSPEDGGGIPHFSLRATVTNLAGTESLLEEGFGVGSYYVPNRRLNERLEIVEGITDRPVIRFSYDCEGPNIQDLHVVRIMEPLPNESSVRITWRLENRGKERQWVAPWVRSHVAPGGSAGPQDRIDLPSISGIKNIRQSAYHPAARNWIAVTDPIEQETMYAVFDADQTHAFLGLWDEPEIDRGFKAAFVPRILEPGEQWETVYRLNAVRGLQHVDFATDELAAQLDYRDGTLTMLLSGAKSMENLQVHARIIAPNGRVWRLDAKRFNIDPNRLARCTYEWEAPGTGVYEFLAQIRHDNGSSVPLGKDTASPHGGIDTQFVVGNPTSQAMEAWTNAPFALDRGSRTLQRELAVAGNPQIWFESSVHKVFPEDRVASGASVNPAYRLRLARRERESFQVVLRPGENTDIHDVQIRPGDLINRESGSRISASDIQVYNVMFHDVPVPSHYEGPTGSWPDALPPHTAFHVQGGHTAPVWITVYAAPDLPAGFYRGPIEISGRGMDTREVWLEVQVYDFTLPVSPIMKTDFGFWSEAAMEGAQARGANPRLDDLQEAYLLNALEHRVTLRELTQLPSESANYRSTLNAYDRHFDTLIRGGATTFSVPASLLDVPEQLRLANDWVVQRGIQERAFVHLAHEPLEPSWPRLLETMQRWKDHAPDIPIMVTTFGLSPFIPSVLDRWAVHAQVFDTLHNRELLTEISSGREVWWYVNHMPPRPYGNFFLDFAAMEHRILFWHAWALGVRGMYYWSINYTDANQDPWTNTLDITPVNGDGLLVYPGAHGPINSIRWEIIRDGLEDYDYLTIFMDRRTQLLERGGHDALLNRAASAYNLNELVPDLVNFPRSPDILLQKRHEIATIIEEMGRALNR